MPNLCGHITNPIFQGHFFLHYILLVLLVNILIYEVLGLKEINIVNLELIYFIRFLFILFNAKVIAEIILLIYYRIHCDYEFEKLFILNYMKY